MFLEHRFEQTVSSLRGSASIPLRLELWNGHCLDLAPHPSVTVGIPNRSALRYFVRPDLNKLGEAFVEGHIKVDGCIRDVFRVAERLASNATGAGRRTWRTASHSRREDREAIEYHYDLSNQFYSLFLDRDMVYSCAYYRDESDTLERAQEQKLDHILRKLALRPGERFLDIGCGWGALIRRAASRYGAVATGITLSRRQFDYARDRIRAEGLEERCSVELCDYRDVQGSRRFDKIASVGMFEHVGLRNLRAYFAKIRSLLFDGGLVLNHGITTNDVENRWVGLGAGEFIDRYVFPNGELPHISLVLKEMSAAGLEITDVESLRRHYARTCDEWAMRLEANRYRAESIVGDKRSRIWRIYLAGCAYGFARGWMNVHQVLACKMASDGTSVFPLTRDYMYRNGGEGSAAGPR